MIRVEVVYALREAQELLEVEVEEGSTVADAIERSGIVHQFPEVGRQPRVVGIFGRVVPEAMTLRGGDRVEIYRPLQLDPKEERRRKRSARG